MIHKSFSLLLTATILSSCTMIPDMSMPSFSASKNWSDVSGYEKPVGDIVATQVAWRDFFRSKELEQVIETALEHNKDLRTTALNIEEARVLYRIERSNLFPHVSLNGDASISETSDESSATGNSFKTELYEANIGIASYELDLFGKIRSRNKSAINDYLGQREAHKVVRNALIAETANAYLQYLADQKLLLLTRKTLEAQQRTYDILYQSLEKGVSTEQDVARAATAVETAKVNLHQYTRLVEQDKNALFLLMGIPQDEAFLPLASLDTLTIRDNLDSGVPSEVLLLRPDVRQAEYALLARNADIGAARAAFFPSITLTGAYGLASQDLGELFTSGAAGAWAFLPQISLPIFQAGQNKANLDLAEIRKEKAVVAYEKAIQTAFREVSDELVARVTYEKQLQAQKRLVAASQTVYDISQARYEAGIDSFLSVLDSQRELYTTQQQEIETQRQYWSNLVTLYKVLGGGAAEETDRTAEQKEIRQSDGFLDLFNDLF